MHEIGTWATADGTTEAYLDLESDDGDVTATELPGWVSDALKGAVAGAVTGAAGGPGGVLAGAATGAALGAASSTGKGAASASASAAGTSADARTKIVQALQQFAAVVPSLVQLVAASGAARKEASTGDAGESLESADGSDWGPESFQGRWTQP